MTEDLPSPEEIAVAHCEGFHPDEGCCGACRPVAEAIQQHIKAERSKAKHLYTALAEAAAHLKAHGYADPESCGCALDAMEALRSPPWITKGTLDRVPYLECMYCGAKAYQTDEVLTTDDIDHETGCVWEVR